MHYNYDYKATRLARVAGGADHLQRRLLLLLLLLAGGTLLRREQVPGYGRQALVQADPVLDADGQLHGQVRADDLDPGQFLQAQRADHDGQHQPGQRRLHGHDPIPADARADLPEEVADESAPVPVTTMLAPDVDAGQDGEHAVLPVHAHRVRAEADGAIVDPDETGAAVEVLHRHRSSRVLLDLVDACGSRSVLVVHVLVVVVVVAVVGSSLLRRCDGDLLHEVVVRLHDPEQDGEPDPVDGQAGVDLGDGVAGAAPLQERVQREPSPSVVQRDQDARVLHRHALAVPGRRIAPEVPPAAGHVRAVHGRQQPFGGRGHNEQRQGPPGRKRRRRRFSDTVAAPAVDGGRLWGARLPNLVERPFANVVDGPRHDRRLHLVDRRRR